MRVDHEYVNEGNEFVQLLTDLIDIFPIFFCSKYFLSPNIFVTNLSD